MRDILVRFVDLDIYGILGILVLIFVKDKQEVFFIVLINMRYFSFNF